MKTAVLGMLLACPLLCARAEPPLYAEKNAKPAVAFSWMDAIKSRVPVLKNERGNLLPMILWTPDFVEQTELPQGVYKDLLGRGLTQHIHIDEKDIPMAKALKEAGSPIIMMQGIGGRWPANQAGDDPKTWQHDFEAGYVPKGPALACPLITKGWEVNADRVRATLQKYKDAGLAVDAVWMDWEGDPAGGEDRYEQALHCKRCREMLPADTLASAKSYSDYAWRRYMDLAGAYLAAPVTEIFPGCSVTNWRATVSTAARPIRNWQDRPYGPVVPPLFTASNPVAYGNTVCFSFWKPTFKLDREHVDQFYTYILLSEVSDDAANRLLWTPGRKSIPWICRWCPDDPDPKIPIMTRERYREVLRHIWLRGTSGMQIFNPVHEGYEDLAVAEVQDAVAVYDEMLQYRGFLEHGTPICLDMPKMQDDGVLWSGLRWGDRAIVRTFKQGGGKANVTVEPWKGSKITLEATAKGKTWELVLKGRQVRVVN